MVSCLNSWPFPLFIDTLRFQIGPLVQKIWYFEIGRPPYFLQIFKKLRPYILETDRPINEKF